MKFVLLLGLITFAAAGKDSTAEGSLGYELLERRLDFLQEKFFDLTKTVDKNQNLTEQKLIDFKEDFSKKSKIFLEQVSTMTERKYANLAESMQKSQKVAEKKVANLAANLDTSNHLILDRLTRLESSLQSQKSLEEKVSKASTMAAEAKQMLKSLVINYCEAPAESGLYKLRDPQANVYCEMTTLGGGWLVIQQRREEFKLNFKRPWADYQAGFGTLGKDTEFWLGLETIHQITKRGQYELAIEMTNEKNEYGYARYGYFRVAGADEHYKLVVDDYSGTVGDKLSKHNGMYFYAPDRDNQNKCAEQASSGWWFTPWENFCFDSNLNFNYVIYWRSWAGQGKSSRMMIRRKLL